MPKASIVRHHRVLVALLSGVTTLASAAAPAAESQPQPLSGIVQAAEAQVRSQLRGVSYEVHVQAGDPDPRLHLARCPRALTTAPIGPAQFGGRVTVRVSCTAPPVAWALYVPVSLESDIQVLVLRQTQARGARLGAQDVAAESRRVAGLGSAYLSDAGALAHRTLTRNLPAGTALTADLFQADYVVRQGQSVTVVAAAPGIEVRAPGRALEDAREGTRVRVQNLASQKIVQGVVDASGIVYATP
jgi:flagellar basal body P-ring formation protein FlgA